MSAPFQKIGHLVVISILLLILNTGCVLKSKHDEVLADYARTNQELSSIKKERDELAVKLEDTQKKLSHLELRNDELSNTNQILAAKNREFANRSMETQQELIQIREEKSRAEQKLEFVSKTYGDLVESLKDEIQKGQVEIAQRGNRLTVNMSDQILFPSGSAKIQSSGKKVLKKVVSVLKKTEKRSIQVEGHTDNIPISGSLKDRFPSNWELSAARAIQVVRFLEDNGVPAERLSAAGYGEHQPRASNKSAEGRQKNRRIEIVLQPPPQQQ